MAARARPTIRCLLDDLAPSLDDANQRSALLSGKLRDLGPTPLDQIAHPLLDKASELVQQDPAGLHKAQISAVTDHPWYRAKIGQWRGAVSIDDDSGRQTWLCAAGLRRDGNNADFYTSFQTACANGSNHLLPTPTDRQRLRLERVHAADGVRHRLLSSQTLAAFCAAIDTGKPQATPVATGIDPLTLRPITGATLLIEAVGADDGSCDEVTLSIRVTDHQTVVYDDVIEEVMQTFPGLAIDDWDVIPATDAHKDPCWYTILDARWLQPLRETISTAGLEGLISDTPDLTDGSDGYSHIVSIRTVEAARIDGRPVRALCGRRFVPQRDPENFEICPKCAQLHGLFEQIVTEIRGP